jgi:gas vesicle protein
MNLTPEQVNILIATVGTLTGALLGSLSTLLITFLNKRSEERRHIRELVIKGAIENWKQHHDLLRASGRPFTAQPLDTYIIHMLKLSEVLLNDEITSENVLEKIEKIEELTSKVSQHKRERAEGKLRS